MIVTAAEKQPEILIITKTLPCNTGKDIQPAAVLYRGISALGRRFVVRLFRRRPCDQVYRTADGIAILIRQKRLEYFDSLYQLGRYDVELDVTNRAFRRRYVHTVDCHIAQTRLRTPDLNVFSLTFIPLERDTGNTAHSVRNVEIWKTLNHRGR